MVRHDHGDRAPLGPLWWVGTGLAGVLLFLVSVPTARGTYQVPLLIALTMSALACGALTVAPRRPLVATGMQFVAAAVIALAAAPVTGQAWPLTIPGVLLLVAHVGIVSVRRDWRLAAGVWAASAVLFAALVAAGADGWPLGATAITFAVYATNSMLILVAGAVWRQRTRVTRQLTATQRDRDQEHNRRTLIEERARIARELHDVVAHTMSVIHVQSSTARYRLPDLDVAAKAEFGQISAASKAAMGEMRQLLGVLRDDGAAAPRAPTAGVSDLRGLAAATARAGTVVSLTVGESLVSRPVPESVQLAVYRIVQEALSNAVRHAPGAAASVDVAVAADAGAVLVTVVNDPAPATVGPSFDGPADAGRARHGLIGIRERATLLGGWSSAGVEPGGGWRVTAHLPLPPVGDVGDDPPLDTASSTTAQVSSGDEVCR